MTCSGRIKTWNPDKGFGFAKPDSGEKDLFIHISDFKDRSRPPAVGQKITFKLSSDSRGRRCGKRVRRAGDKSYSSGDGFSLLVSFIFLFVVILSSFLNYTPVLIFWFYLGMCVVTFCLYAWDKSSALSNLQRTRESTLHIFALLGGWPGAVFAQQIFRHKTRKAEFRAVFWGISLYLSIELLFEYS